MKPHVHVARRHAKRRAFSRYGTRVNRHELRELIQTIQQGRSTFLWRESLTRTWHLVNLKGQPAVVVYGNHTHTIHTFLTPKQAQRTLTPKGISIPASSQ